MSIGKRSIATFLTILTVCWLILVVRNESHRAADSLTLLQSRTRTTDADNATILANSLEMDKAATGPLFHIVFTVETFSTLNLRCIESIFYFHPNGRLRIYSNALSSLPLVAASSPAHETTTSILDTTSSSALRNIPIGIRALMELGYDIKIVSYSAADILGQAEQWSRQTKNSLLDTSATALWASRLDVWKTEKYWYSNEANLLRLCLLYTEGGIYLDTDVILVRPLVPTTFRPPQRELSRDTFQPRDSADETGLALDNAMARDGRSFHNAVMKFMQPGNPLLAAAITDFVQNYNGTVWGNNGPRVFRRTSMAHMSMLCPDLDSSKARTNDGRLGTESKQKPDCWLQPLPAESFQPVPWRQWGDYCFDRQKSPVHAKAVRIVTAPGVYAIHMNNHIFGEALEKGMYVADSVCDHVLHAFCILACPRSTNETVPEEQGRA
jgi:Alpha 1,4-glycosyltransferase conserved region/Glycosyltransferase sugar-binding region containing DXD motif